ncbi:MAG: hypothetical protein J6U31_09300 [Bacteroidales bacterium]|nr:hypothetical protein [Bacteroidales bacterium]
MKKSILTLCLCLMAFVGSVSFAQQQPAKVKQGGRVSFEQFLAHKTQFLLKEMQLPAEDSARFVPIYKDLQKEKGDLMRRYRKSREVGHRIRRGENVPDSLYAFAVFSDAQLQIEDAQLDKAYLEKFAKVLTPQQLYSYQEAERKFRDSLARQPRRDPKQADPQDKNNPKQK